MKKQIVCKNAPAAIGPYSQAIAANGMLFVSGQLPIDPVTGDMNEDVKEQTRQALENVKAIVTEAGGSMDNIVKCSVYMSDLGDFGEMNEAYGKFFNDPAPARVTFEVARLPKDAQVEIEAIVML